MSADYKTLLGLVREFVEEMDKCGAVWDDANKDLVDRARAAIAPSAPKPPNDPKIVHTGVGQDTCCGPRFAKAGRHGELDHAELWSCPKCGTEWWKVQRVGDMFTWQAHPVFTVGRI